MGKGGRPAASRRQTFVTASCAYCMRVNVSWLAANCATLGPYTVPLSVMPDVNKASCAVAGCASVFDRCCGPGELIGALQENGEVKLAREASAPRQEIMSL